MFRSKEENKKQMTYYRERAHKFTEQEDIAIITGIVSNKTAKELAKELNLTYCQVQGRVNSLKDKGLRIDRINNTQQVVSLQILNRNAFNERQEFLKAVEKLINKVVIKRELKCKNNGELKTSFKTWNKGEINTLKFYKGVKTVDEFSNLFNRSTSDVEKKLNQV